MKILVANTEFNVPSHISEITLRKRIEFDQMFGDGIQEDFNKIEKEIEDEDEKTIALSELYFDRAFKAISFFTGIPIDNLNNVPAEEIVSLFEGHFKNLLSVESEDYDNRSFLIDGHVYWLPTVELLPTSRISFNQFITSKEVTRNLSKAPSEKLTALAYIAAIFLKREGDEFTDHDIEGAVMEELFDLPITTALRIGKWYDHFCNYIAENFSVFKESTKKKKGMVDTTPHFEKWGWISFLNYVAKNGTLFYKSNGLSNLDNIKQADLYEVLIWASCEKDLEKIIQAHQDEQTRKSKS